MLSGLLEALFLPAARVTSQVAKRAAGHGEAVNGRSRNMDEVAGEMRFDPRSDPAKARVWCGQDQASLPSTSVLRSAVRKWRR
jgi:hypothetical protein